MAKNNGAIRATIALREKRTARMVGLHLNRTDLERLTKIQKAWSIGRNSFAVTPISTVAYQIFLVGLDRVEKTTGVNQKNEPQ